MKSPLHWPPTSNSCADCAPSYPRVPTPFCNSHGLSEASNKLGGLVSGPAIFSLFLSRGPSAVTSAIGSVIVNSIERSAFWPFPHIVVKIKERFSPWFTDGNSTPSVIHISRLVFVSASGEHAGPNPVFRRICHSVRQFCIEASARGIFAAVQMRCGAQKYVSAMTSAKPCNTFNGPSLNRGNCQRATEELSRKIRRSIGEWYNFVRHFGTCNIELARWARAFTPRLPTIILSGLSNV